MRSRDDRRWVLVLAAGDGRRLEALTRAADGRQVPKQFCSFCSGRSLLGDALERAFKLARREHVVVVVAERHRAWWEADPDVARLPARNVVVQPENRGTAAGVLLGALRIRREAPGAQLAVLASDHFVRDEETLAVAFERALDHATRGDRPLVLLGITPDAADAGYGWIVPAPGGGVTQPVAAFVEKPPLEEAERLLRHGALWSSFLFAAGLEELLGLYGRAAPDVLRALNGADVADMERETRLREIYPQLPVRDLSRDVLERCVDRLAVLAVPDVGWSDLGTPERLARCLGTRRGAVRAGGGGRWACGSCAASRAASRWPRRAAGRRGRRAATSRGAPRPGRTAGLPCACRTC
jgi:mannose-1-phosphate guanylyltransferase